MTKEEFIAGIAKCSLLFDDEVISAEPVISDTIALFSSALFETKTRRCSLLHTGSIAYDAVVVFVSALADILLFYKNDDDFLLTLKPGDIVINTSYGRRQRQKVVECIPGESLTVMMTKTCRSTIPWNGESIKYIVPNVGRGTHIGGMGLRQSGEKERALFFKSVFNLDHHNIPRLPKSYTVIVGAREDAQRIYKSFSISFTSDAGELVSVKMQDIFGGIYITPEQYISLGGALSSENSVLRFCSSLTMANDILREARDDAAASLLVISNEALLAGDSALFNKLSSMRRKNFVFSSIPTSSSATDIILKNVGEGGKLLSFTRKYLRQKICPPIDGKGIVGEIRAQVRSAAAWSLKNRVVEGFMTFDEFKNWLGIVKAFKLDSVANDARCEFLDEALGLFNFLKGCVFNTEEIDCIEGLEWRGRPLSPTRRIAELKKIIERFDGRTRDNATKMVSSLELINHKLASDNPKKNELLKILNEYRSANKRGIIVVPQERYKILFDKNCSARYGMPIDIDLEIATPNTFGRSNAGGGRGRYDFVISVGGLEGKRFSPLTCTCADEVYVLLYDIENKRFGVSMRNAVRKEKVLNNESSFQDYENALNTTASEFVEEENRIEHEVEAFLKEYKERESLRIAEKYGKLSGIKRNAEVKAIGTFSSGEKIFFTEFYKPYVICEESGEIKEVEISDLSSGDTLLFTQNNNASKDIVDIMLSDYIAAMQIPAAKMDLQQSLFKSKRWRQVLRDFASRNRLSAADIANQMQSVHEVTVKNWLDEESHIVGPRDKSSLTKIAVLTSDEDINMHTNEYFDACKSVRERRIKLLHELGSHIRGGMALKKAAADDGSAEIASKIKDIVSLCTLEEFVMAPPGLTMNSIYVNRPIFEEAKEGV